MKSQLQYKFLSLVFFILLGGKVLAAEPPLNILFIGNSFTHMNSMPKMFDRIATSNKQKVHVEMSAKSNHTFKMHCERPEMFDKIKSRKWDYVIIQGFSRELIDDYSYIDTACIPYFNEIVDSIYISNPCTSILLYETWGYKNGLNDSTHVMTFDAMTDFIERGYKYLSELYNIPIVPVGKVWQDVTNKHKGINLYAEDLAHPSQYGSYLVACSFYTAIFKKSADDSFTDGLDPVKIKAIHASAYNYILTNIDMYKLKMNSMFVSSEKLKNGNLKVRCKEYFRDADSIRWDFGDGKFSNYHSLSHVYTKEGTYLIKLTVFDKCGVRVLFKEETLKKVKVPPKTTSPPKQ